ncbi:hypothetical protein BBBOND_0308830 [Babesia bigemina]|uniref:Uncharacterized protein n=1 Tax=Babesia bigemina TaxID=5866 RepID=A0A061DEA7_BABBI|nr:hypothetical protein BBBOND_0308830 [Babesia bigemina]CDR96980.1 hypothetical protein BBBOND_0308830 [Babesia bigemina]|eukprot:XP_012769166.1 hypothetical protein BBBOND_0308830 [Babesia bigemina]
MAGMSLYPGKQCTRCHNECRYSYVCNCCPWCCKICRDDYCDVCFGYAFKRQRNRDPSYKCATFNCKIRCAGNEYTCECECCKEKKRRGDVVAPPPPAPRSTSDSSDAQPQAAKLELSPRDKDQTQDHDSPPSPPPYSAIAAVIVAIIVAIILLDLCIFRFPVGRNIRDFLVRKIPFCIAFYS